MADETLDQFKEELKQFVDSIIVLGMHHNYSFPQAEHNDTVLKLMILQRVLELVRSLFPQFDNDLSVRAIIERLEVRNGRLHFGMAKEIRRVELRAYRRSEDLQVPLLVIEDK